MVAQSISGSISLPTPEYPLEYWNAGYRVHWLQPLDRQRKFIFTARGEFDYGDSYGQTQGYPFFENYYAGGIGTVRGFEGNTLGPRDSQGYSIGGNTLLDGSVGLILPAWSQNIRTTAFVDAGNVFAGSVDFNEIRFSAGVGVIWRIPMLGPMEFSLAVPLNKKSGDDIQYFNFNIGTSF